MERKGVREFMHARATIFTFHAHVSSFIIHNNIQPYQHASTACIPDTMFYVYILYGCLCICNNEILLKRTRYFTQFSVALFAIHKYMFYHFVH